MVDYKQSYSTALGLVRKLVHRVPTQKRVREEDRALGDEGQVKETG